MDPATVAYPQRLSSLVGKAIRAAALKCFEQVVIDLQPGPNPVSPAFPGFSVRYATGPVLLNPSGQAVTVKGHAVLLASLGSWMRTPAGIGYQGFNDLFPTQVSHVLELRLTENVGGVSTWAIGVDKRRNFHAYSVASPPRLVIQIQISP